MPTTSTDSSENSTRRPHYSKIVSTLNQKIKELHQEDFKKLEFTPPELAAEAGVNYNTAHKNGVFHLLKARHDSLEYSRWEGITIDIENYVEENGLLESEGDEIE